MEIDIRTKKEGKKKENKTSTSKAMESTSRLVNWKDSPISLCFTVAQQGAH